MAYGRNGACEQCENSHLREHLFGDIWEKWGVTYGRNGEKREFACAPAPLANCSMTRMTLRRFASESFPTKKACVTVEFVRQTQKKGGLHSSKRCPGDGKNNGGGRGGGLALTRVGAKCVCVCDSNYMSTIITQPHHPTLIHPPSSTNPHHPTLIMNE